MSLVPAEVDYCASCDDAVQTTEQHFIRLTSPFITRSFMVCVECWSSFMYELSGSPSGREIIDVEAKEVK